MTAKTFDRQTAKFLAVVGENMPELSSEVMQGWIQNPKGVQKVLKEAFCPPEVTSRFKVWKTIKLGTGLKTADDFRRALYDGEFNITGCADDILENPAFTVATEEIEVDLVKVTVAELGLKKGARRDQVYERVKEIGLNLCPPEVGPQLRLQYLDQPNEELVLIGIEPIADSDGDLNVFNVTRGGLWLRLASSGGNPGSVCFPEHQWVFVLPRK